MVSQFEMNVSRGINLDSKIVSVGKDVISMKGLSGIKQGSFFWIENRRGREKKDNTMKPSKDKMQHQSVQNLRSKQTEIVKKGDGGDKREVREEGFKQAEKGKIGSQ